LFKFKFKKKKSHGFSQAELGILVFENTSEVICAQKALETNGWKIRVMGPPPEIQSGCDLVGDKLRIDGKQIPVNRGTPALLGAMVNSLKVLGQKDIIGFIAGDIGLGDGSRKVYQYLVENRSQIDFQAIVFHYLQPDVDWHNKILFMLNDLEKKPVLIADANFKSGKNCSKS